MLQAAPADVLVPQVLNAINSAELLGLNDHLRHAALLATAANTHHSLDAVMGAATKTFASDPEGDAFVAHYLDALVCCTHELDRLDHLAAEFCREYVGAIRRVEPPAASPSSSSSTVSSPRSGGDGASPEQPSAGLLGKRAARGDEPEVGSPASSSVGSTSPVAGDSGSSTSQRKTAARKNVRKASLPKPVTTYLKRWLYDHMFNPYPGEEEKEEIARQTNLTLTQINNWFINARRRNLQGMIEHARQQGVQPDTGVFPTAGLAMPTMLTMGSHLNTPTMKHIHSLFQQPAVSPHNR